MISLEVLRRYPYFAGVGEESLKRLAMIANFWPFRMVSSPVIVFTFSAIRLTPAGRCLAKTPSAPIPPRP